MGHKKIAYIHGADSSVTQNRVGSFYKTLSELGIDIPDIYVRMVFIMMPIQHTDLPRSYWIKDHQPV